MRTKLAIVCIILSSCIQPTGPDDVADVAASPELSPIEEERTGMELNALQIYPAYYQEDSGTIYGIPADLQGLKHKVKIEVTGTVEKDGEAVEVKPKVVTFYASGGGELIIVTERTEPAQTEGEEPTVIRETFVQDIMDTGEIIKDTYEEMDEVVPQRDHVVEEFSGFVINHPAAGDNSELWNTYPDFVTDVTPQGHGPIIRDMIHGAVRLDHGLLIASERGLEFVPEKRVSANVVAGPGRLWH